MRSYYQSMGKADKIGNKAFRWARAKVFNRNKRSVGRAIAFGCTTRCHLSVHSLAMPRSGLDDGSNGGGVEGGGLGEARVEGAREGAGRGRGVRWGRGWGVTRGWGWRRWR